MALTPMEQRTRGACERRFAVLIFALTLFYAAVCTPLYLFFSSDILFDDSVLPLLWDVLMGACNYLFYWVGFAFLLFLGARYSLRGCKAFFAVYAGAVLFRYVANQLSGFLVMGFPTWSKFASSDLPELLFCIVMDLVLMAFAVLAFHLIVDKTPLKINADETLMLSDATVYPRVHLWDDAQNVNKTPLKINADETLMQSDATVYPRVHLWYDAQKLYDRSNALHRTALWMGLIPAAAQLLYRVRYDIFYGAPTDALDLMWMIVYYVGDILCAIIGYLVILLLLNSLLARFYNENEKEEIQSNVDVIEGE